MRTIQCLAIAISFVVSLPGCKGESEKTKPTEPTPPAVKKDDHGHSHERGKMLIADVGRKYHALLTAHLSPKGNELDIFFETPDSKNPSPAAIPVESFTAQITLAGEDKSREVKFEPASLEERPRGEKAGTSSRFVASVPWMKANAQMTVVVQLQLGEERFRITWENFNPKKYAHHEE